MGFVKSILKIGSNENSIETTEGFAFNGEFDLDAMWGKLDFSLPYTIDNTVDSGVDITRLKKEDTVKLYFKELETNKANVRPEDLVLVFDGRIKEIKLSKGKESIDYTIHAEGTFSLTEERRTEAKRTTGPLISSTGTSGLFFDILNDSGLDRDLKGNPLFKVRLTDIELGVLNVNAEGGRNPASIFKSIREKYAIIIHQSGDGFVNLMTPFFLLSAKEDETLNVNAWQFELGVNIFDIDYGDLTSNIQGVVVFGKPGSVGTAVDVSAVERKTGKAFADVDQADIAYQTFENRDLVSDKACQKVARNKLLEIERNNFTTFKTKFEPEFQVGQPFQLKDNDRFTGNEIFIIKKYNFTIDKEDVSARITGYTHSLTLLPQEIVLKDTGIADVDTLEIREKTDSLFGLEKLKSLSD